VTCSAFARRATLALLSLGLAAAATPATADITDSEAREWRPDMGAAREYASSRAGDVSFAVLDLVRRKHAHDGGNSAAMASTFKVMLMVAYLRQDSVDDRDLTAYDKDLIKPMIRRSDNARATRIRDVLGREPIERFANRAKMKDFQWNSIWGYCRTSARDQAFFMRKVHKFVPQRHRDFAMRQLARIVPSQRWGVGRVDLDGWRLHFKGGWGSGSGAVDHQVAQLEREGRRIGVAVMTEGNPDHRYGKETLEGVFRRLLRGLPR
jgi:hypothetical protein